MFEFESGKLAVVRANAATTTFTQQMLTDHEKTTGELKGLVTSGKVQAPLRRQ
jgi:putative membrane protein